MFSHRLFDKSRMTIAARKRQLQFHLAAVLTLAGVSFLPSVMTPMNLVVINQSLSSSSNLSGQQAVLDSVHRSTIVSSGWQKAIKIPSSKAIVNSGGVTSLSCSSVGNCSAGGYYTASHGTQAFVINEVHGIWHKAIEVPDIVALNKSGDATVKSLSCSSVGNCSAGGYYTDFAGTQAFVVNEVHGIWQRAIEVPTSKASDNSGGVTSLSCSSVGNCSAGGYYSDSLSDEQPFLVNEVHGIWHKAIGVPGIGALNSGEARVTSLSCSSAGNCSAGGYYYYGDWSFLVNEVHGIWHQAIRMTGSTTLNSGEARVTSLSCSSAGNCSAGGYYCSILTNCSSGSSFLGSSSNEQPFLVNEVHGIWHKAIGVPGIGALNNSGDAGVTSLSCSSVGNCSAGGYYTASSGTQAFVVNEVHGIWHKAIELPGIGALNNGDATVKSLSCSSAGNCSAGGYYTDFAGTQAFVVNEVHGIWQRAIEVPTSKASDNSGEVTSLSCSSAGNCSAGGSYTYFSANQYNPSYGTQAFVVNEVHGTTTAGIEGRGGGQGGIDYWILIVVLLAGVIISLFGLYRYLGKKKTSGKETPVTGEVFADQPLTELM